MEGRVLILGGLGKEFVVPLADPDAPPTLSWYIKSIARVVGFFVFGLDSRGAGVGLGLGHQNVVKVLLKILLGQLKNPIF